MDEYGGSLAVNMSLSIGLAYILLLLAGVITIIVVGARMRAQPIEWARHVTWLKERPWTWLIAFRIGLILLLLQLVAVWLYQIAVKIGWLSGNEPELFWVLLQGIFLHAAIFFIFAVVIWRRNMSWRNAFGFQRTGLVKQVSHGMVGYLAVLPIIFCVSITYHLFLIFFGYPMTIQDMALFFLKQHSVWTIVAIFVLAVIVAPVAEEALFRGMLLPILMRSIGVGPAVFFTSIAFALIHFHIPSIMPLFVLALAFSIAYIYTKSIVVPIIMHALFNGLNLGLLLIVAS